ncbi:uncharacterized protein C8A04DRAFT_28808 [Dichotomopilus funicola]|uniref:Uncharacterized protein n=1 Tax=Dichotomopilus funicola TaxID=1934379 RepID=A0AAN6V3I8_9PEZI|nr:hypothetical protein C8A04DRAFT_28808 [Dichotomopilus funicola]
MTAHLPDIPFPSTIAEPGSSPASSNGRGPSEMCFFIEYIRQCRILGEILSHVYQPSAGGQQPTQTQNPHQQHQQHGLGLGQGMGGQGQQSWFGRETHGMDAILGLDAKLTRYETELPAIMSWKAPCDISGLDAERKLIIATQRTVLRGSFLYLRLMLHRPILTQLCANTESTSSPTNQTTTATSTGSGPGTGTEAPSSPLLLRTGSAAVSAGRELFTSFAAGCAKICLGAAVDLIELVHSTYLTNTSGGWWWDGLYAFTAGLAVIVGYLSPSLLASMDKQRLERSWMRCQEILAHFTSFSVSAQRSLRLLQKVHGDVMSRCSDQELPLGLPAMSAGPIGPGEAAMAGQQAGFHMNPEDMPLDLGSGFQWQMPGSDMMGAGLVFNWDQSLDMISGGLGMDLYP